MKMPAEIKAVHPITWVAVAVLLGCGVMAYHTWMPTEDDRDWLDPQQPPKNANVPMADVPAGHTTEPFRHRAYKGDLTEPRGLRQTIVGML